MSLATELEAMRKEIRTDGYPMSIGELANLYLSNELDIHPEFQRFFRWEPEQKSRFIESILLGIPLPPIFVSQRSSDGVWDVVDGLHRLSTIFELMGILKAEDSTTRPPLRLTRTKYLPSLENKIWENQDDPINSLTADQRIDFKRSKLHVSILLKESDQLAKFELFQRLNTGGSALSDQEVRNCILVAANVGAFRWLRELAETPMFTACLPLTQKALDEQYDVELALRFLVLSKIDVALLSPGFDVAELLTDEMIRFASDKSYDYEAAKARFRGVFELLGKKFGENAFKKYDVSGDRFLGAFSISVFETLACGLGFAFPELPPDGKLPALVKEIWESPVFTKYSGSGVRASSRLPHLLPLGRQLAQHYAAAND